MPDPKPTPPENPPVIDLSNLPAGPLRVLLKRFLSKDPLPKDFLARLKDLPKKTKRVVLRTWVKPPRKIRTWESEIDKKTGDLIILINPKYKPGRENCGRMLFHEISHHTKTMDEFSARAVKEWKAAHMESWHDLLARGIDAERAERALRYGIEEERIVLEANRFAKEIGESPSKLTTIEEAMNYYLYHHPK